MSAHDFAFTALDGSPLPLARYKGKPLLVVNTASKCGFTPQLKGLGELARTYQARGLTVLGVPSNDFGGQEPLEGEAIRGFCDSMGAGIPLTEKTHVTGAEAHPFYRWAAAETGPLGKVRWNFYKYLIDADGRLADWFSPITAPGASKLTKAVERVL